MPFPIQRLDDHIVEINLDFLVNYILKDSHYGPLICCPSIVQSELHNGIAISTPRSNESCIILMIWMHLDLVIPPEPIDKRLQLVSGYIAYDRIYVGQLKLIFRAGCIHILIIDTNLDLSVRFRYSHDVC